MLKIFIGPNGYGKTYELKELKLDYMMKKRKQIKIGDTIKFLKEPELNDFFMLRL